MLTNGLVNNIAFKALSLTGLTPIWIILYFLFKPDFSSLNIGGIALAVPVMILAFLINYLLSAAITALAFWTTRVYSIHEFFYATMLLFSGQVVPLTLMPGIVQSIAQYLPFQLLMYYPIQVMLGKLSTEEIILGYVMAVIWLVVSALLFNWVWRNGIKRYSAVGA
jgi:ABC-2 type transport system permease protein